MIDLERLLELSGGKNVTIAAATERSGNINRKAADRILDPHDYFGQNKRKNHIREYLAQVESDRDHVVNLRNPRNPAEQQ